MEAEEHARQDGDRVLLVVDVRERGDVRVDVVRKVLVPDLGMRWGQRVREESGGGGAHPREAVAEGLEGHARDVQREEHGVEQRDGSACACDGGSVPAENSPEKGRQLTE